MRRGALALLLLGAVAATYFLSPRAQGAARVTGRVTGRYGTIRLVRVVAEAQGRLLAEAWTDTDGRYSLDVPPGVRFELRALPIAATYLIPEERSIALRPGETKEVAFDLKTIPLTRGTITGAGFAPAITLRAVPEEAKEGSGTIARISGFGFEFWGLRTGAPYRLSGGSVDWEIDGTVSFRGGDEEIVVPLRRILTCALEVHECPQGNRIPRFTAKVVNPAGETFATLEGKDGRLFWTAPHPDPLEPEDARWTLVVEASGYFGHRARGLRDYVWLQPLREPNITLLVEDADGDVAAHGIARGGFGSTDARATRIGPGRYSAVLPPGRWWIWVERGPGHEAQRLDVTIGETDGVVVRVPPFVRRGPR